VHDAESMQRVKRFGGAHEERDETRNGDTVLGGCREGLIQWDAVDELACEKGAARILSVGLCKTEVEDAGDRRNVQLSEDLKLVDEPLGDPRLRVRVEALEHHRRVVRESIANQIDAPAAAFTYTTVESVSIRETHSRPG
jgi:hypothetical protein